MRKKLIDHDRRFVLCTGQVASAGGLMQYPMSHIIGEMYHLPREGMNVTVLAVYETSRLVNDVPTSLPPIKVYAIGDAVVECRRCDKNREWEISRGALLSLMARLLRKAPVQGV